MNNKRLLSILFLILTIDISYGAQSAKPIANYIAVLDIDVSGISNKSISRPLTDSIRNEFIQKSEFEVFDRANMDKIFREQGFQQAVCTEPGCAVELGKVLGVGKIIIGSVSKIGETYYFTISIVSVETGKIENTAEDTVRGELDELLAASKWLASSLLRSVAISQSKAGITSGGAGKKAIADIGLGVEFVQVTGGCFMMGDALGQGEEAERPLHEVCLKNYYISKTEITQAQWKKLMGSNPSYFTNCDTCPVESVSYNDVMAFLEALNKLTTQVHRLPTEAEWEFAAKNGTRGAAPVQLNDTAWYIDNSRGKSHGVATRKPNLLGIYDMLGNVWEWVADIYDPHYYEGSARQDPKGAESGRLRTVRGGSWNSPVNNLTTSYRKGMDPAAKSKYVGFRIAF